MTRAELLAEYASGRRDFTGVILGGIDLTNVDLTRINLRGADMAGAILIGTILRGANLNRTNLRDALMTHANLYGTYLDGVILRGATLCGASIYSADMRGADLRGADLRGAIIRDTKLVGADLRGANLAGTILRRIILAGADLEAAVGLPDAPVVEDLHRRVAEAVGEHGEHLNMYSWHCGTSHCRAGWAITLAGQAGAELEAAVGANLAGALIYHASTGTVPDFFAPNATALKDIKACAGN